MKRLLSIAILLLAAFGCSDEMKFQQVPLTTNLIYADEQPTGVEGDAPSGGRTQSVCTMTKAWTTIASLNGFSGATVDYTFSTYHLGGDSIRDGEATFTVTNNHDEPMYVWVYGFEFKKKTIPAYGSVTYTWPVADCSINYSIVKRYVFQGTGNCISATFNNSSWTNGHTTTGTTGLSFSTGNGGPC
jgi:hypothetical protein